MKCVLIASKGSEVLFYWTDEEFQATLRQRYGATEHEQAPSFADSINTLFAPLLISCVTLLAELHDTYTCFTTERGHLCVLHLFGECLYIAVNGDGAESEDDLRRKLYVLKRLCEAHFGLVTLEGSLMKMELRPTDTEQRDRVWALFQNLLLTYGRLREEDQSFVVEAVERLIHPQLCEECIEILERQVVQQINSSSERGGEEVMHAFILVHTKLLAFFSSRNASSVRAADLLTLILIVQNQYPSSSAVAELNPEPTEDLPAFVRLKISDRISVPQREGSTCSPATEGLDLGVQEVEGSTGPEEYYTPEPSPSARIQGAEDFEDKATAFRFANSDIQMAEDSLCTLEAPFPEPTNPCRIFLDANLRDGYCPLMPHSMYCLPLWPGISLVLLTKIPNNHVALSLYQLLDGFSVVEKKLKEEPEDEVAPNLRSLPIMSDLRHRTDRFVRTLAGIEVQLQSTWHEFKKKAFSRSELGTSTDLLRACSSVKSQLCSVYRRCFLVSPIGGRSQLSQNLQDRAMKLFQEKLMDWKDFLLVKSTRNITLRSYLDDFPGLVHFIYVDRTAGQMVAPSINVSEQSTYDLGKGPLASFIRNKIWSLIGMARRYLQKGYTTLALRDGDYYCTFFLWFENETGDRLEVIDIPVLADDSAPIGMLAGDYYRKLLRYYSKHHPAEVVKCYELLTIHLGIMPTDCVIQQCCTLARRLWEPSRIPLL
ncbi:BLOC-3 complex member HPS1 [Ambystoma mexicanum]|uniref:BLOC-3 complex member HPS1 n=1 Tax=Ambystoma mexicanum TaxID=8296 RepID=UPI0037E9C6E8